METKKIITRKVTASVEIEYSVAIDEARGYDQQDKVNEDIAISLAISPNFTEIVTGVRLNSVNVLSPDRTFYADFNNTDLQ